MLQATKIASKEQDLICRCNDNEFKSQELVPPMSATAVEYPQSHVLPQYVTGLVDFAQGQGPMFSDPYRQTPCSSDFYGGGSRSIPPCQQMPENLCPPCRRMGHQPCAFYSFPYQHESEFEKRTWLNEAHQAHEISEYHADEEHEKRLYQCAAFFPLVLLGAWLSSIRYTNARG